MEHHIQNVEQLESLVPVLLKFAGDRKKIFFTGEIGAGKTTFIQSICRYLGVEGRITSPTFSLINEYAYSVDGEEKNLYHMDLYRLKTLEEALDIGIVEYLEGPSFCLIEWPEIIEDLWPEEHVKINIEILEDSKRKILFL